MEQKFKTKTKFTPGTLEGECLGIHYVVPAANLVHAIVIEINPPFTVYAVILDFIIVAN